MQEEHKTPNLIGGAERDLTADLLTKNLLDLKQFVERATAATA
jgi:hypothetical protein